MLTALWHFYVCVMGFLPSAVDSPQLRRSFGVFWFFFFASVCAVKRFSPQTQLNKSKCERKRSVLVHSTEDSITETVLKKNNLTEVYREREFLQICKNYKMQRTKQLMSVLFATCHIVDTLFLATLCWRELQNISLYILRRCHHQCSMFRALYITEAAVLLRELTSAFRNN